MNNPKVPNTLIYTIPDIDKTKKLSNYIANALENKGFSCTPYLVDLVITKLNLSNKEEYTKDDIQNITNVIKQISNIKNENKIIDNTIIYPENEEQYHNNEEVVAYEQYDKLPDIENDNIQILSDKPNPIPQNDESGMMETDVKLVSTVVIIDSKDRNTEKWSSINPFGISFGYPSGTKAGDSQSFKGYLDKVVNNVYEIELIEAIIPVSTYNGDNLALYPYLLLEIDELGSNFTGSNQYINKSFAKISFFEKNGNYYYYKKDDNNLNKKIFSPRISLNKLTFTLKTPDGTTVNVQSYIDEAKKKKSHVVYTFNIKSYQRSLETIYVY